MKALRKSLRRPWVAGPLVGAVTLALILAARSAGWLQRPELRIYDQFMRWGALPNAGDDRIVICGLTEDDLRKYGHPLDDRRLAQLLEALAAQKPCVIGLDIYRELKEPRSGEFYPQLADVFRRLENVIAIERYPTIPPPPALADRPDRTAPNNFPLDHEIDGLHRRAYLFLEHGLPQPRASFALTLALAYLEANGADFEMVTSSEGIPLLRLGRTILPRLTPDAGGYVGLPVFDYEILADYRGPHRFREFSFGDVLEGRVTPGALAGKIVLVAATAESVKDSNPTPIDANLRGVIQHGIVAHQLLRAALEDTRPMRWWPEIGEAGWIAAWTFAGAALGLCIRSPLLLGAAAAGLVALISGAAWLAFARDVWIPAAAPALGALAGATFCTSLGAFLERSDRRIMAALFSKHVSPSVADALWAEREQFLDGGRLKPRRLTATVLFTDLKGFSTTSEGMDAADLLAWMNEYMNGIARHVDLHGGMVNKYMGDAIMAVFGAPVAAVNDAGIDADAVRAVECALAMRSEMSGLNAAWRERGMPEAAMRIGIYTGPLVAGSIGSDQRLEFTVLGDSVNTAARLESAGKDAGDHPGSAECTILIGDSTQHRLGERFVTECIGPMNLKGKSNLVIVHRVISEITP